MLRSMLIGYGHAARSFHAPALRRMRCQGLTTAPIGVVDVAFRRGDHADAELLLRHRPADLVHDLPPEQTIVHICTPPGAHLSALEQCVDAGYRSFVVEKPLVDNRGDLEAVGALAESRGLDVLVVANWLSSRLTDAVVERLERPGVRLERLTLRSWKSRIGKTLASSAHKTAFDVEMPHLVALAARLCGPLAELRYSWSSDLVVSDQVVPKMGAADIVVRAPGGFDAHLSTSLRSPRRDRSLLVRWADGMRLVGHYPCDSTDLFSQLSVIDSSGALLEHRLFEDDTVLSFLSAAYGYFEGHAPRPLSDLAFHTDVMRLLLDARDRSKPLPLDLAAGAPS